MTDLRTIAIVGAGLAGAKAAEALRKEGYAGTVTLYGDEAGSPYLRPPLSKDYLRGESDPDNVLVHPDAWYAEHQIDLRPSSAVRAIDPGSNEIVLDGRRREPFDRLLIATGAAPRRLEIGGSALQGIHYLRTLDDAGAIQAATATARRAVVIGGGWIGAEVAASIRSLGVPVALVAGGSVPLERVLGPEVGTIYRDLHVEHGVEIFPNERVTAFLGDGDGAVEGVETAGGARVEGDLVVVGVGATPRAELAAAAGLEVGDGILVNEFLETSAPGIFAAGDVAAAWHPLFETRLRVEHWDNARRQGRIAARNMLGLAEPYDRVPYFYSDQFDLSMEYAGYAPAWDRVIFRGVPASRVFVAFWLKNGRVVAGMNANVPKVNAAISALVGSRKQVDAERLVDPDVPLDDLEGLLSRRDLATA